jgi:benzoyl-CoA reductase/2-hydroxyglutaryl-CoA dehydratase subunit BcrC/BadD/HgdB
MKKIGITTTVPVEVLLAAGYQPVDLNNILVADPQPGRLITIAERDGFPLNCCSWIKGIYGVSRESDIKDVLCVTGGDCSNTLMLMEVLRLKGFNTIPFAYPDRPDIDEMQRAILTLAATLGTTLEAAEEVRNELQPCRDLIFKLDDLTWQDNLVSGGENHLWLVSSSDFNGDFRKYQRDIKKLIEECLQRQPYPAGELRLAYIGVPAVYARDLYKYIERHGGRVVFNEVQRQFAMPEPGQSLAEQYTHYTYPYSIRERLEDIKPELSRRRIDGIIHYVQAFCHRGIGDIVFRETFDLPVLTLEGNDDFFLNNHIKTRIEAFLDMLRRSKNPRTLKSKSVKSHG